MVMTRLESVVSSSTSRKPSSSSSSSCCSKACWERSRGALVEEVEVGGAWAGVRTGLSLSLLRTGFIVNNHDLQTVNHRLSHDTTDVITCHHCLVHRQPIIITSLSTEDHNCRDVWRHLVDRCCRSTDWWPFLLVNPGLNSVPHWC